MSSEHAFDSGDGSAGAEGGEVGSARESPVTLDAIVGTDRERLVTDVGVVAAFAIAVAAAVRIVRNVPGEPVAVPELVHAVATVGVPVVVGLGLLAVGLASARPTTRIGLAFAGVFAPMAAIDPAASLPAVAAVTTGGAIGVLGALDAPEDPADWAAVGSLAVAGAFLLSIAITLAATTATIDGGFRPLGTGIALVAIGGLAIRTEGNRLALAAGALAGLATLLIATANPFAAGGTLLAGFAVVSVPLVLVGVAVAGGVAAIVAGLLRGETSLVAGSVLVLLAGMPTTAPRASAVVLGAALAVVGPARLTTAQDRTGAQDRTDSSRSEVRA